MSNPGKKSLSFYENENIPPLRPVKASTSSSSCLSPNAKEFVPRRPKSEKNNSDIETLSKNVEGMKMPSVQNRLNLCGGQNSSQPTAHLAIHNETSHSQEITSSPTVEENNVLNCTSQLVNLLNEDPGVFDSIQDDVLHVFEGFENNEFVLSNAMEIIFSQSIEEQNFRYMGAKLYQLLDSMVPRSNSLFKYLLKLKLNYHQEEISDHRRVKAEKVRGTTLFLAELYMQLRNDGSRMKEIADNIVVTINQLLREPTSENVKCICLTLKLAGYELEIDCPSEISKIINDLQALTLDASAKRVLDNVLNLRKNTWGRIETTNQLETTEDIPNNSCGEPVLYGPDGHVLTEEESSFLESNILFDDKDLEDMDSDPEMSGEMQCAYKAFLNSSTKNK